MSDMETVLKPHLFTVDEYHRMAEAGLFDDGPAVELLDGVVVEMAPIGKRHWVMHHRIWRYLTVALEGLAEVPGHLSLPLGDRSEPQPDIAVLMPSAVADVTTRVHPAEILAMVELAETSLGKDAGPKRLLYARFGIPDYLIVDLRGEVLLNYNAPVGGDYGEPRRLHRGDAFALTAFPSITLEASAFLP